MYQAKTPTAIILEEATALPNADTTEYTSFQFYKRDYKTIVRVYANTDILIANTKSLTINLAISSDDTTFADLTSLMYSATAGVGTITFDAGDLICEQVVPENVVDNGKYVCVSITTTDDQSAEKVDITVDAL